MLIFKKRLWAERLKTVKNYYRYPKFAVLDLTYSLISLISNPYKACRKFNQKIKEKEIYTYGETPFSTYERIVKLAGVKKGDLWIEMGSGRGIGCFWLAYFIGCDVVGIERVPTFIRLSNLIKILFCMKNPTFIKGDFQSASLRGATFIYLYGIWPEIEIPENTKVITTGEPLDGLSILNSFWIRFPWGRTRAFVQEKK